MHRRGAGAGGGPGGGRVAAWRLSRTGTWLRAQGLLQWHQVSPGAANTQAHLQGYLRVAVRGEHQALHAGGQGPQCTGGHLTEGAVRRTHGSAVHRGTLTHTCRDRRTGSRRSHHQSGCLDLGPAPPPDLPVSMPAGSRQGAQPELATSGPCSLGDDWPCEVPGALESPLWALDPEWALA